ELSDWHGTLPDFSGARSDRSRTAAALGDRQGPEMVMGKLQGAPGELEAAGTMDAKAEAVSLLVDGGLPHERVEHVCSSLREPECIRTWVCYHVIGDALRGLPAMPAGFAARFSERLAAEPTVLAPTRARPAPTAVAWAAAA